MRSRARARVLLAATAREFSLIYWLRTSIFMASVKRSSDRERERAESNFAGTTGSKILIGRFKLARFLTPLLDIANI